MIDSDGLSRIENLFIIIYFNRNLTQPLKMSEFVPLNEYLSKLPEDISVMRAVKFDDDMPTDEVRLEAILSGKNLEL